MATRFSMQRRLRMNRPSLRLRSKPPKATEKGMVDFTAANLGKLMRGASVRHFRSLVLNRPLQFLK